MNTPSMRARRLTALVLGACALAAAGAAGARDLNWSVGISSPGVAVGVSNAPAVVYAPGYVVRPRPIYYSAPPVYYAAPPVYYAAPPVYYAPPPVYYVAPRYGRPGNGNRGHHHPRRWRD